MDYMTLCVCVCVDYVGHKHNTNNYKEMYR